MSTTTTITPKDFGEKSDKKKKILAHAAEASAAAGLGVAGATIVSAHGEIPDIPQAEEVTEITEVVQDDVMPAGVVQPEDAQQVASVSTQQTEITEEPQPVTSGSDSRTDVVNEITEPADVVTPNEAHQTASGAANPDTPETVNPGEIADAIIAEEQIDPNDIDMANVVDFDEIGTVYTVDGESYTAAAFHDAAGNQLVMVDMDGDDVFDVVTDMEGNMLAQVPGNITVDDAELGIVDDGVYLAHHDGELTDEFGADSIAQDLLS